MIYNKLLEQNAENRTLLSSTVFMNGKASI